MIEIPLSKSGKHAGKYAAIVDESDRDLSDLNWYFKDSRGSIYARRGYCKKVIYIHRLICERILNRSLNPGELVDHKNGITLDNRRENIRVCSSSQNGMNKSIQRNNKLGYKGVTIHQGKIRATIVVDRKSLHIGYFSTLEEAHKAYCVAAVEYFGEFARFE